MPFMTVHIIRDFIVY